MQPVIKRGIKMYKVMLCFVLTLSITGCAGNNKKVEKSTSIDEIKTQEMDSNQKEYLQVLERFVL